MLALRPLFGLLVALALTLGTAASDAGAMAGMARDQMAAPVGVDHSMPEGCPDCDDAGRMSACPQTACGVVAAILPQAQVLAAGTPAAFTPAADRIDVGLPRSADPPPPRAFVPR